jgi:hypothetical protein
MNNVEFGLSLALKTASTSDLFEGNVAKIISGFSTFDVSNSSLIKAASENQLEFVQYFLTLEDEEEADDDELPPQLAPVLTRQNAVWKERDIDAALRIAVENGFEEIEQELRRHGARLDDE